jgi:hypothetical protein
MARRALVPGDLVAACPHKAARRQAHIADRLDAATALACGVLIPHTQYRVVAPVFVGRGAHKLLIIALPDGQETRVAPGAVRLWTNALERKHRREAQRAAEGG